MLPVGFGSSRVRNLSFLWNEKIFETTKRAYLDYSVSRCEIVFAPAVT